MIAPYVAAAAAAPLRDRPSLLDAETRAIAERDRVSIFGAAFVQWREQHAQPEPELAL